MLCLRCVSVRCSAKGRSVQELGITYGIGGARRKRVVMRIRIRIVIGLSRNERGTLSEGAKLIDSSLEHHQQRAIRLHPVLLGRPHIAIHPT